MGEFSKNTYPNLFYSNKFGSNYYSANKVLVDKNVQMVQDTRYPAYANTLEDARLVTDYRPQCSKNIQSDKQFYTKLWMINHASEIINESRKRQSAWTGANFELANTRPPPAHIVRSTPFYSEIQPTGVQMGIGIERADSICPELFGTFKFEPSMEEYHNNRKNIELNYFQEGGRNSIRGGGKASPLNPLQ